MNKETLSDNKNLNSLVNNLMLFNDSKIDGLTDLKLHRQNILSGWTGIYDLIGRRNGDTEVEISIRYAYSDEVLLQDLIDFMYSAELLIESSFVGRDKYIVYICKFEVPSGLKEIEIPIPEHFLPGKGFKIIRYLVEEKAVKITENLILRQHNILTGYSTKNVNPDDKNNPLISVVIPTFNSGRTIEQTIQSVINQTYKNVELIIIDGGSVDGTNKIVEKYKNLINVYISEKDKGIFDAINKGTNLSRGHYSVFIGADDLIFCDGLERFVEQIKRNAYPDFLYGDMMGMRLNGVITKKHSFIRSKKYGEFSVFHPSLFISKKVFEEFGGFDLRYKGTADADFELKLITNKKTGIKVDHYFSLFREGGLTFLYKNKYSEAFEIFRKNNALSFKFLTNYLKFNVYRLAAIFLKLTKQRY